MPIEVDIILVGFSGDGGYGYKLQPDRLLNLLATHLQWYCPYSWETEEELGVCMHVNFQVVSNEEDPEVRGMSGAAVWQHEAAARRSSGSSSGCSSGGGSIAAAAAAQLCRPTCWQLGRVTLQTCQMAGPGPSITTSSSSSGGIDGSNICQLPASFGDTRQAA